uniref:Uncharacterized protein n=1 Tax=Arundo donax TaxID=35708 RepID=A0A0A9BUX8_ARUDO
MKNWRRTTSLPMCTLLFKSIEDLFIPMFLQLVLWNLLFGMLLLMRR